MVKKRHTFVVTYLTDKSMADEIDEQLILQNALGRVLKENGIERFAVAPEEVISKAANHAAKELLPTDEELRNIITEFMRNNRVKKNAGIYIVKEFMSGVELGVSFEDLSEEDKTLNDVYIFNLFMPDSRGGEYINVAGTYTAEDMTGTEAIASIQDAFKRTQGERK